MVNTIMEMMSHLFIQRAILVGSLVSLCAALLGVSLVLKRYGMIGDGLSHVGFGVMTVATALGLTTPLYIAIPGVMLFAIILLTFSLIRRLKFKTSASIFAPLNKPLLTNNPI